MANIIIAMLLITTLISAMIAIEKNEDNKKKQKELEKNKEYTTSRWGYNLTMELERYKRLLEFVSNDSAMYKNMLREREKETDLMFKEKNEYYAKLEQLYKDDQRLKEIAGD